ncbi:kinesin-related protein 4-like isoform X2 [Condylostylus longicornis]|uniref:kinesin-related protein 4-like isoform X2 n=1 Tax=Condylostylus longicornis TaxID=2530218 RepID=UPI00244E2610|nr:kinesin-related protein 4-like isoform X2 [Condylostylus longicornis]
MYICAIKGKRNVIMNEIDENNLKSSDVNATIVNSCIESTKTTSHNDDEPNEKSYLQKNKNEFEQKNQQHYNTSDNDVKAILNEISGIYSERITEIDLKAAGDHKLKCDTYKEWIQILIEFIHYMFENLKELELNAKNAIIHLEKRLNHRRILDHADLNNENLKNDFLNLLTLIRRVVEQGNCDATGLDFKTITKEQIFDTENQTNICNQSSINIQKLNSQIIENRNEIDKLSSENYILKNEIEEKDLLISNLQSKINKLEKVEKFECNPATRNNNDDSVSDDVVGKLKNCLGEQEQLLAKELEKNEVLTTELEIMKAKCERKEKVIESMKSLAFEVADKHDQIQQQKAHLLTMEEELQQAHKKIQFKDSVIKDLRRDLKSQLTKSSNSEMSTCYPNYNVLNKLNIPYNVIGDQGEELAQVKQQDVNKLIELEESKLIACQAEEDVNLKILLLELDELWQLKQCVGNESLKELEQMIERFRNRIQNMAIDQTSMKNKLQHMRETLLKIVNGQYVCKNIENDRTDCNDISPNGNNFDIELLRRVNEKIFKLENELCSVKNQFGGLQLEIERTHSNLNSKDRILEKQKYILKHLAEYLGQIIGVPINFETILQESNENENKDLFIRNILCDGLENILMKKEKTIKELQEYNQQIEDTLNGREVFLAEINNKLKEKEEMIRQLNENLHYNEESIKVLTHEKHCLNEEIQKQSASLKNSDIKKLLNEIEELQTLNKNQVTTISNLMEALENIKREHHTTGNVFNSNERLGNVQNSNTTDTSDIVDNTQNRSGSLWGWFRGNTYDV